MDTLDTTISQIMPPRILSQEEQEKLTNQNTKLVSNFKSEKLEKEAQKMWDLFYKRNSINFFKDRHWTFREFQELTLLQSKMDKVVLLEAGCGVGNTIFPILNEIDNIFVYACDFSSRAIKLIQENPSFDPRKCSAFQHDLTCRSLTDVIPENSVDLVTLLFVLSSIHPNKFDYVLQDIFKILKPGGMLLFRDYGLYDWAMIRFKPGSKISDNLYVRQDGTRAYYFEKEFMSKLVTSIGFKVHSNEYMMRETTNKKEEVTVPRVFLQGRYVKLPSEHS